MRLHIRWYLRSVKIAWHAFNRFKERAELNYTYRYKEGWLKEIEESFLRAEVAKWQDDSTALLDDSRLGIRYVCQERKDTWHIITCLPLPKVAQIA